MKTLPFALRLVALLLLPGPFASAHEPLPPTGTPLVIPFGEERTFYIVADVEEENATAYNFVSNVDDTVAHVTSQLSFARKKFGSWTIRGDKEGETTTMVFHWKYKKDKSGNEGDENETVLVQVVAPGTSSAAHLRRGEQRHAAAVHRRHRSHLHLR